MVNRVLPLLKFTPPGCRARPRLALSLVALLLMAGCSSTPVTPPELPQTPAAFRATDPRWVEAAPAESQPRGEWWKTFADPALDQLIEAATRDNTSIQAAAARLTKARALARETDANRMPQAGINAGFNQQGGPLINAAGSSGTLWTLAGSISYEADIFGRLAQERNAATLDAESREALLQSTRLLVQADVAQNYFNLRALDAERAVVRDAWQLHLKTLQVAERRFELGSIAELDVARLRADAAAAEAELLALDRRRAEAEHALALLAGQVATVFQVEASPWNAAMPVIPPGIPSTLLTRRPDVAAAQRSLLASQARLGVAKTAWFPNLSLTTSQGFASTNLRDLIAVTSRAWGLGALLSLPIFDGGRREAGIQVAGADVDAAIAGYREQILVAFKEVEDQLSALRFLADQDQAQAQAVAAASRAKTLAHSRYNSGLASQLEVLDAQRTELRNQRQALQVRASRYQSTVSLIRALGGSWDSRPADSAANAGTSGVTQAAGL